MEGHRGLCAALHPAVTDGQMEVRVQGIDDYLCVVVHVIECTSSIYGHNFSIILKPDMCV